MQLRTVSGSIEPFRCARGATCRKLHPRCYYRTDLRDAHAAVVLEPNITIAHARGLADARASELTRAAERLEAVTHDRDESLTQVKRLGSAARSETPSGVPRTKGLLVLRVLRWAAIVMTGLLVVPFVIWIVALWLRS